jgi:hypothetical protein
MLSTVDDEGGILFSGYGGGLLGDVSVIIRTTMGGLYVSPNLILPFNNSINVNLNTSLVWGSSHVVNFFRVQISTDTSFSNIIFDSTNVTTSILQVKHLLPQTKYFWRIQSFGKEGGATGWSQVWNFVTQSTVFVEDDADVPLSFSLEQNYPNPFNPTTKISWQSPVSSRQVLKVFDVLGNEIVTLLDKEMEAGYHSVNFDASELPSGVYFYQLRAGSFVETKKMMLLR